MLVDFLAKHFSRAYCKTHLYPRMYSFCTYATSYIFGLNAALHFHQNSELFEAVCTAKLLK